MIQIPEELEPQSISRRRMLKRIGAGAAVAWSAPVLSSIRTPAFAQTPPPPDCREGNRCPGPCTDPGCQSGGCTGGLGCFDYGPDTEGRSHCYQNIYCSCVTPCNSCADCQPGQYCQPNTGCGSQGVCLDCCGENCRAPEGGGRPRGAKARR